MRTTDLKLNVTLQTVIKIVAISRGPSGVRVKMRVEGEEAWYRAGDEVVIDLCVNREEKRN